MWKHRIISYTTSILHVLLVVFLGYLISVGSFANLITPLPILLFAAFTKLYLIVLMESIKDLLKIVYSFILIFLSIIILTRLTHLQIVVGMSILIFYSLYLIFKRRAPFKFIHHTLRYVLLFFFAYNKSDVNDMIVQMALLAIILFSVAGELVSWPIEETPDKIVISPSGRKRSYIVAVISIVVASLLSVYVLNGLFEFPIRVGSTYLSFYLIPFLIVTSVLVKPIIKAVQEGQANLHYSHGKRELVIMTTIFLIISTISAIGAENVVDVEINSESYVLDSEIWTMIAGKESWDVPWIFFDYVDQDNFHYLLLHKNGILELGRVVNGKEKIYLASAKTDLSPFQPHNFHITLNKTTIFINLDDKYQLITTRNPPYRNIRVKITRSYLSFIGDVKITTEGLS